jgi:hypothetical protein
MEEDDPTFPATVRRQERGRLCRRLGSWFSGLLKRLECRLDPEEQDPIDGWKLRRENR